MKQNNRSASLAVAAYLNVRSSERTFTPASQPKVTHQTLCASRAPTNELRTCGSQPVRTPGRDDFHVVPDFSGYATRRNQSRSATQTEPAIPFPKFGIAPIPHSTNFPRKKARFSASFRVPNQKTFFESEPFQPSSLILSF